MAEWTIATDSKSGVPSSASRVRIPPSPTFYLSRHCFWAEKMHRIGVLMKARPAFNGHSVPWETAAPPFLRLVALL